VLSNSEFRDNEFKNAFNRSKSVSLIPLSQYDSEDVRLQTQKESGNIEINLNNSESMHGVDKNSAGGSKHQRVTQNNPVGGTSYIEFMLSIQDFGIGIPADKLNNLFINFGNLEEHQKTNP
jgi:signal transduction histidine kinase